MVTIQSVTPGSMAAHAGIRGGDRLLSANGHDVRDVLDYRFYLTDRSVRLELEREGERYAVTLNKGEYDDIGLEFATPLMDKKRSCANACVFCFVDQMPPGMRQTLYFKDDDDRLSFLHGNYVTLTNLHDADIQRLIAMHLSPINVSVHTTNPELRVKMMKNRRAGEVLAYLPRLAEAGIALCTQIVLCRGLNDGAELDRTMRDLCALHPALRSCAVVPAGLTRFREGLYPLEPFTPAECAGVIEQVNRFGDDCLRRLGTRLFYCADELYVRAGLPVPPEEYYEDFSQLENGVGMLASQQSEFDFALEELDARLPDFRPPRTVTVATGVAAYAHICGLAHRLEARVPGLTVRVRRIVNRFFGESVTVAGLLTGKDVSEQLAGEELGDELLFPAAMLRAEGDVFLDDMTPARLSELLGVPVRAAGNDGESLLRALLGV